MDRLDAMRVFVRVVETGSFSAVARELGVGQPAISKQIAALESHVGAQLLQRTSRSLRVTQVGTDFYAVASRLVDELDAALLHAGRRDAAPVGLVRVTVAPVLGRLYMLPRLPALFERHPQLAVELVISTHHDNLLEDNLDVAIRSGALADSSLVARPIGATPLLTVASTTYLARHDEPTSLRDLARHRCIIFSRNGAPRPWRFADGAVHHPSGHFRTNDAEQIRAAVLEHLGIAQVPGWLLAPELDAGTVRSILPDYAPAAIPIAVVRPAGRLAAKVRVFIDFLRTTFAREPMLSASARKR